MVCTLGFCYPLTNQGLIHFEHVYSLLNHSGPILSNLEDLQVVPYHDSFVILIAVSSDIPTQRNGIISIFISSSLISSQQNAGI